MKWLRIDYIKQHSRLDFDDDDALLTLYAESAEATIENVIGQTYEELLENYNEVPAPIIHASLMLVELSYTQRSPITPTNMSMVPYTFETLVKPYMILNHDGI